MHTSAVRVLSQTGQLDPSSWYNNTPGFHIVVAMLSQLSKVPADLWGKLLPPLLGCIVPLAFYQLCIRTGMPSSLMRIVVVLSALSLPLLYQLNGTDFTAPLVVLFVCIVIFRVSGRTRGNVNLPFTLVLFLLTATIILWHPSTSLVLPVVLLLAGFLYALGERRQLFLRESRALLFLGLLGITGVLAYWMYDADFVWSHFVKNIGYVIHSDLGPDLVPVRFFEIGYGDQLLIAMFFHGRDGVLVALAVIGIVLVVKRGGRSTFERTLRTYALMWLLFVSIVPVLLITQFGVQGYRRFMVYVAILSPPLAGYGLWRVQQAVRVPLPWLSRPLVLGASLTVVVLVSAVQLYPYQPLVPKLEVPGFPGRQTPVDWMHEVNTAYQYHLLRYSARVESDRQLVADYIGHRQAYLFFGSETQARLRRPRHQAPDVAYLFLHWPGRAGVYYEPAEYRSVYTLQDWRRREGMSTVYDNGGSFVLYYAENAQYPFDLEDR
jgi:hypothetical protein